MTDTFIILLAVSQLVLLVMVRILMNKVVKLEASDFIQDEAIDLLYEMNEPSCCGDEVLDKDSFGILLEMKDKDIKNKPKKCLTKIKK